LLEPALAFVVALGQRLKELSPYIIYDTRTNGSGSLMRIYRDVRFSKDKTPYKTHVTMMFWEGAGKKTQNPGFYVRIEPAGASIFVGQHIFSRPTLAAYRDAVVDETTGTELEAAIEAVRVAGAYQVGGEHYKRVPRGYGPEHERSGLLRYNGLYAFAPRVGAQHLTSPDLVDLCFEHCRYMAPLHRWLVKLAKQAAG
jgi:uncharacterized protein (TIGR02453 family)